MSKTTKPHGLTYEDVVSRVNEITDKVVAGDDEAAHAREDSLYLDLLWTFVHTNISRAAIRELTITALKTQDLNFVRHCA